MLQREPDRAQHFFTELREEFDEVRGTALESDYARALPAFEPHLPADQWQLHFGDIDPTPVDLALTGLSMSPPGAAAGERVIFTATIANQGTGAAAPFSARLTIDGAALRDLSVPGLAPGASTFIEFPAWIAVLGPHQLRASADALSRLSEPVELDNHLERRIVVGSAPRGLPDLSVAAVDLSTADPRAGQPVSFVASVENTGGNVLPAFVVRFAVDDVEIGEVVVDGLASGEKRDVPSPRPWSAVLRRHAVSVEVDAGAAVPESDEGDNALVRRFRVRPRLKGR
jgi:subtilase family serine protease